MWARIAVPASVFVVAIAVNSNRYVDGNTRTGLEKFNELYSGRLTKTDFDTPSRQLFDLAATKYGPPQQHRLVKSEEDPNSRRTHHIVGHIRRGEKWFEEKFTFRNNRRGTDIISDYICTPLQLDDAEFESKFGKSQ